MLNNTTITIAGNLTEDPELRFTPSGVAVCRITVAQNPKIYDKAAGTWEDGTPAFHRVTVWRQMAENVASSFGKGERVIVVGRLEQTHWTTDQGEKRSAWQITADEVGGSVAWAVAKMSRANHRGDVPPSQEWDNATGSRPEGDPWGNGSDADKPF